MQETLGGAGYRAAWFRFWTTSRLIGSKSAQNALTVTGKSQSKIVLQGNGMCIF